MRKYPNYKPSGIEWLEEIPEHWNISRLKYLGDLYGGLTGKSGVDFNNDENPKNKPYIPYTNIFNNTYISKDHFNYVSIDEDEIQNRVKKYDMFFLMSSETFKDLGKSCILIDDVDELYLNSFCKGYRIKDENIYPLFLNYQILGHLHREMISYEGKGFTRINLRQDKLNDLFIFYPPLPEQLQIVQFLDEKTDLIDKLISSKERKINLLKEQRTSLINEVITKGLNPNVKMKDSGVEWIGEIPEHWGYKSLKYIVSCNLKSLSENTDPVYELNYIEISDLDSSGNIKNTTPYFFKDCPSRCRRILSKGDVIVSSVRTYLRSIGYIENDVKDLICSTGFCVLTPNDTIISKFLFYQILTENFIGEVISKSVGVSYPSITSTELTNIKIIVPNKKEQHQIVQFLDEKTNEIDELVSLEQKKIDLLKEYRQSLISEVITGKIDVRTNLN
jgi:type I restriction enzyme S subunit